MRHPFVSPVSPVQPCHILFAPPPNPSLIASIVSKLLPCVHQQIHQNQPRTVFCGWILIQKVQSPTHVNLSPHLKRSWKNGQVMLSAKPNPTQKIPWQLGSSCSRSILCTNQGLKGCLSFNNWLHGKPLIMFWKCPIWVCLKEFDWGRQVVSTKNNKVNSFFPEPFHFMSNNKIRLTR